MPDRPIGGRALVTRRAVIDIVRGVTLGQYGVAELLLQRPRGALETLGVASTERHLAAVAEQQLHRGEPDAVRAAGDDRAQTFEAEIHQPCQPGSGFPAMNARNSGGGGPAVPQRSIRCGTRRQTRGSCVTSSICAISVVYSTTKSLGSVK